MTESLTGMTFKFTSEEKAHIKESIANIKQYILSKVADILRPGEQFRIRYTSGNHSSEGIQIQSDAVYFDCLSNVSDESESDTYFEQCAQIICDWSEIERECDVAVNNFCNVRKQITEFSLSPIG